MTNLRIDAPAAGHLRISGLEPFLVHCLEQVPAILAQRHQPRARQRLFPDPLPGDAPANEDWHRLMDPDLDHLFLDAGEIIARDLATIAADQITFPAAHGPAWMSALNQARLILAATFRVTDAEMNQPQLDFQDAKQRAILEIHLLGYLLHLLVEHEQPGAA